MPPIIPHFSSSIQSVHIPVVAAGRLPPLGSSALLPPRSPGTSSIRSRAGGRSGQQDGPSGKWFPVSHILETNFESWSESLSYCDPFLAQPKDPCLRHSWIPVYHHCLRPLTLTARINRMVRLGSGHPPSPSNKHPPWVMGGPPSPTHGGLT